MISDSDSSSDSSSSGSDLEEIRRFKKRQKKLKKKQKKAKKKAKKAAKGQVDRGDGVLVNLGKAILIYDIIAKLILEPKSDIPSDPPTHFLTRVNSDDEGDERKRRTERDDRDDKPRERRERKDDSGRRIKGAFLPKNAT